MVWMVTVLYVLGFLLVVASLAVGIPVTRRALDRMESGAKGLRGHKKKVVERLRNDIGYDNLSEQEKAENIRRIEVEATDEVNREAKAIGVDFTHGMTFGGDDSRTIANAVRYVARVNRPTAVLALGGGLVSTIASILSLYA